jgi:mannosyl-oligosaccharide glucosidase
MAVTAFIDRLERAANGPADEELGLGNAPGSQHVLKGSSSSLSGVHLRDREAAVAYFNTIYPALRRHYDWFRRTQRGQIKQYGRKARSRTEAYRWRGRSEEHVLTSGMDDYPRGPPHAGELHLDLMAWMAFFSRTMRRIAEFVGERDDITTFIDNERAVLNNMEDLHWNEEEKAYCDVSVNDDGITFPLLSSFRVLTLNPQTNRCMYAIEATSHCSRSYLDCYLPHRPTSGIY